ncbi:transposase [Domibacillus sp. A3M-37]|uniref:transposase n=1 Tax=Domibacillus sp. A3M-37 TaxID=2962037 RepID=UPI0035BED256
MDQKTKKMIDILPTRSKEEVTKWLKQHTHIKSVSRDGSKTYRKAIFSCKSRNHENQ